MQSNVNQLERFSSKASRDHAKERIGADQPSRVPGSPAWLIEKLDDLPPDHPCQGPFPTD